jgi:hypothetical protein
MTIDLFPFAHYWWFYAAFTAGVLLLLALDLGVFHRDAHEVGFREAATWSVVWVALALAFNYGLYRPRGAPRPRLRSCFWSQTWRAMCSHRGSRQLGDGQRHGGRPGPGFPEQSIPTFLILRTPAAR